MAGACAQRRLGLEARSGELLEVGERITAQAQRRLCELDEETDAVWRERERLLGDVREVSRTLATLADAASERFPAADPAPESGLAPESAGTESASPATTVE
jgi:hypothetical protein